MGFPLSPQQVSSQLVGLVFRPQRVSIGAIVLDATIREVHGSSVELTEHPVEDGKNITDHIRSTPDELEIQGIISDTPVELFEWLKAQTRFLDRRSTDAYNALRELMNAGTILTVTTRLRTYNNMVMTSLRVDRDASTGRVMNATILLREIIIAATKTVEAATPIEKSNDPTTDRGKVASTAASAPVVQKAESVGSGVLDAVQAGVKSVF